MPSQSPTRARGKGTYVIACSSCHTRKIKCDTARPCGPCHKAGKASECKWDRHPRGRGGMTEHTMRLGKLERTVEALVQQLSSCSCQGHANHPSQGDCIEEPMESASSDGYSTDPDLPIANPTDNLKLRDDDLVLHYNISVFAYEAPPAAPFPRSRIPLADPRKRYCLQVDGEPLPTFINPQFEFDRYLPRALPGGLMLDRQEHDRCLAILFKFVMPWGQRVILPLFLRDMYDAINPERPRPGPNDPLPKTHHFSPLLHNALVALALAFSNDPAFKDQSVRECFANQAKSFLDQECEKPSLSAIHGLNVLGTYHSANGDQTLGFLYAGMATRISQALGLNINSSPLVASRVITEEHLRDRVWTWWTIYCQEICWSGFLGRDICIPSSGPSQGVPLPYVEQEYDKLKWAFLQAGIPEQDNNISLTFTATCSLMIIIRKVMEALATLATSRARQVPDHFVTLIDTQLEAWDDNLDPRLKINDESAQVATPHVLMLHSVRWWTTILLHRPFFHCRGQLNRTTHATLCKTAAEKIMFYTGIRQRLYTLRYVPVTFAQIIFAAGIVHLFLAAQASAGSHPDREQVQEHIDQATVVIKDLHEMGESFACANKIAKILQDFLENRVDPVLQKKLGISFVSGNASGAPDESMPVSSSNNEFSVYAGWGSNGCWPWPPSGFLTTEEGVTGLYPDPNAPMMQDELQWEPTSTYGNGGAGSSTEFVQGSSTHGSSLPLFPTQQAWGEFAMSPEGGTNGQFWLFG